MGHSTICAMEELGRALERQHREEEKKKQAEAAEMAKVKGLDTHLWRPVRVDGDLVAALYFNGKKDSISDELREELEGAIRDVLSRQGKQTITMEFVTTCEVGPPPISRVGKPLICNNLPKGGRDVI